MTVIREGIRLEPWLAAKNFGKDAASLAFFLLVRSCYARRPSVVVLQDLMVCTVILEAPRSDSCISCIRLVEPNDLEESDTDTREDYKNLLHTLTT